MWSKEKIRKAYKNEWEKYHSEESEVREQMFQNINSGQRAEIEKAYNKLLKTKEQLENFGTNVLGFSEKEMKDIKKECGVK